MAVQLKGDLAPERAMRRALLKIEESGPWTENVIEASNILRDAIHQLDLVDDAKRRGLLK